MWGPKGLIGEPDGALYTIEAVFAGLVIISMLAYVNSIPAVASPDQHDDLKLMSADLLHVLMYAGGDLAHPGLARALSSQTAWAEHSLALGAELRGFMPAGYRAYLHTPYGDTGDCPPDDVAMSIRPFLAYGQDTGEMVECSLIVWRP